jgi:hypothetical protein
MSSDTREITQREYVLSIIRIGVTVLRLVHIIAKLGHYVVIRLKYTFWRAHKINAGEFEKLFLVFGIKPKKSRTLATMSPRKGNGKPRVEWLLNHTAEYN